MAYNYPYGNGQQLNLDWFLNEWKNLLAAWEAEKNGIEGALQAEIDRAEAALADVFAARDAAAQSAANALESKNAAAQSASDASGYLATVRADANTASNAAQNAAQSESNAAESAQTALASKNTAANSERNAAQSEANALTSKNAAAQSAADALAHKDAAAQSAADALAHKDAAAQSAEDAEDVAASVEASAQQITTNTRDISNLKESIINTAPPIIKATSGNPVNIKDGAENKKIRKIDVTVKEEAGETGKITRYGKNLFQIDGSDETLNGVTAHKNEDGTWRIYGRSTSQVPFILKRKILNDDELYLPKGTFTISRGSPDNFIYIQGVPFSGTILYTTSNNTFVQNQDISMRYLDIGITANAYNIDIDIIITPLLCYNVFDTTFEAPIKESINVEITGATVVIENAITTLTGNNTIISNFGNIDSLEYSADTKLYIDNKIAELQATMLENIGG